MSRLLLLLILLVVLPMSSCDFDCGVDGTSNSISSCRSLNSALKKSQIAGFGACGSVVNTRKLKISCTSTSGSNATCTSRSNNSGYYAVIVPNNNRGNFIDSTYSTARGNGPITGCEMLWNALNSSADSRPSDIVGVYQGDSTTGDFVTCTDATGCKVTSPNCFSGWDSTNGVPSGTAASIANGVYLGCAFIDSPYTDGTVPQGIPPLIGLPAGLISSAPPDAFNSIEFKNPITNPILFNNWVDFQRGTDRCSSTTNSRKIKISCDPSSGGLGTCTTASNRSGYFVVVVPNNGGGSFIDSNYSTALGNGPITSCATLWTAMSGADGLRPTDIKAYYHGDPAASDSVTCDDTNGCTATSADCFSGWDSVAQSPAGRAATIANGAYLACAFIDSPYSGLPAQGTPPAASVGLVGISTATGFASVNFTSPGQNPITLNAWVNY